MQRALRLFAVFALAVSVFAFAIPASAVTPTSCNGVPATIIGTTAAETLTGTSGDDVILGLGGADVIDGGAGNDLICGGHGDDTIMGGDGDDTVYGFKDNDVIEGGMGNDALFGGDGDDTLRGNEDNDVLVGGIGDDLLNGGYGDDTIRGNDGDDRAYGAPGNDRVEGGPGADYVDGADGTDELYGHGGDDELIGGGDDDLLFGGAGFDTSNGGDGFDRCLGTESATDCEDDDLNDPPVAQDDEFATDEDTPTEGDLLVDNGYGPDDDPNGDALSVSAIEGNDGAIGVPFTLPSGAEVTASADGTFEYNPNGMFDHLAPEEFEVDTFEYTVSDPNGESDTAIVMVTIDGINDGPTAEDDGIDVNEHDEGYEGDLFVDNGNGPDSDPEDDELRIIAINGNPLEEGEGEFWYEEELLLGWAYILDNGMIYYESFAFEEGFLGVGASITDSFEYTITDGELESTAIVAITVHGENDAPIADDVKGPPTDEETAVSVDGLERFAFDPDFGDRLSVSDAGPTEATMGTVLYQNGSVLYDPAGGLDFVPEGEVYVDEFEYTVTDDHGASDSALVSIPVSGINDIPVAMDDTPTTDEDTPVDIDVLVNDEDADDGAILEVIALDFDDTIGTVSILPTNEVRYVPAPDFFGEDTFEYAIQDEHGAMSSATVTVTVGSVNDLPVANDDLENETLEDEALTIDVTANDTDVEDLPADLTPVVVIGPENGTAEVVNGEIVYTPEADFWGPDGFEYKVIDLDSGESVELAFVEIFVIPVNDPPVAVDDLDVPAYEDEPTFIDVLVNDDDIDSPFWIFDVTQPEHGWVDWGEGGPVAANAVAFEPENGFVGLWYFPDEDYNGPDSFTYTISDGEFLSTATVTINVMPINDAPMPADDFAETDEDIAVTIDVVDNDEDIDNPKEDLTPIISDGPTFGTVEVIDGQVVYTPDPDFYGEDSFWYYLNDGTDDSFWDSLVIITVHPVNDAPVAVDDLDVPAYEDEPAFIDVLFNDDDVDSPFWIFDFTQPENGWVDWGRDARDGINELILIEGETLLYWPDEDYFGPDSFTYTITDGDLFSTATVTINVMPVNDAPLPNDDLAETDEDVAVTIDVVDNDEDVDNTKEELTPIIDSDPTNGTAEVVDGQIVYTPDPDFNGEDSFWYYLYDGTDFSPWDSLVTVTVHPVNDDPVAVGDEAETSEDKEAWIFVLDNDYDIDEPDSIHIVGWTDPEHGAVSSGNEPLVGLNINGGGFLVYTPDPDYFGPDTFDYTIEDESGAQATATVEVFVVSVNDLPVPFDDGPITTDEDTPVTIDVTANDEDVEDASNLLTPVVVEGPSNGSTDVVDGQVVYTPDEDFSGSDGFWYVVFDTEPEESLVAAWVEIEVLEVNDDPIAKDDSGEGFRMRSDESSFVTASVLDNDYDVDSGPLSVTAIDVVGTAGTVIPGPNGTFTYENTGALGEGDTDSWLYRVIDGDGGEAWAMVTISINQTPIAGDDLIEAGEDDGEVSGSLLGNDSDADDDDLMVTPLGPIELSDGGWIIGTMVVDEFGDYTLTLDEGLNALAEGETVSDTFMYGVDDGYGGIAMATVTVRVAGENDDPVAADDFMVALDFGHVGNLFESNDGPPDYDPDASDSLFVTDVLEGIPFEGGFLIELFGEGGPAVLLIHLNGDVELLSEGAFDVFEFIDFIYEVSDGHGGFATAGVSMIIDVFGLEA